MKSTILGTLAVAWFWYTRHERLVDLRTCDMSEHRELWHRAWEDAHRTAQVTQQFLPIVPVLVDVYERTHQPFAIDPLISDLHILLFAAGGGKIGNEDAERKAIRQLIEKTINDKFLKEVETMPSVMRPVLLNGGGKCKFVVHTSVTD